MPAHRTPSAPPAPSRRGPEQADPAIANADATAPARAVAGRLLPAHSHASHHRRRSQSASPLPPPSPRRRQPPLPPTTARPRYTTPRSDRGGTGSGGSSLLRRRGAGERHPGRPDVRVRPRPPEGGEEEPAAAFTTAARVAGEPFGRRRGWKGWKKRAAAARVGRRPVALRGAMRTARGVFPPAIYEGPGMSGYSFHTGRRGCLLTTIFSCGSLAPPFQSLRFKLGRLVPSTGPMHTPPLKQNSRAHVCLGRPAPATTTKPRRL
jgi:hypothetical protein